MRVGQKNARAACSASGAASVAAIITALSAIAASAEMATAPVLRDADFDAYAEQFAVAGDDRRPAVDFVDRYARDAGDAFFFAPGVFVNELDANEPRIVLRGFGLGSRLDRSGVLILRDGAPLTDVHGTTNIQEINLRAVSHVDIVRGGGVAATTGDTLGGAVNFVSPTGGDDAGGRFVRVDGGASIEGTPGGKVHASQAGRSADGRLDYYSSLAAGYESGFRVNNEAVDGVFNGNFGFHPSADVTTRFFLEIVKSDIELAGGLTRAELEADIQNAAAPIGLGPLFPGGPVIELAGGAEGDRFGRDVATARIANQTDFGLLGHDLQFGAHFTRRDVTSPQIDYAGIVEEAGAEWGARLAISRPVKVMGVETAYRFGAAYSSGAQDSDRFENLDGARGPQTADTRQKSSDLTVFAGALVKPLERLAVDAGGALRRVERTLTVEDNDSVARAFTGVSARIRASYQLTKTLEATAELSRAYEPPAFSELIAASPTALSDLEEQDTFTYEAGLNGALGRRVVWRLAAFDTSVENEILNVADPESTGLGATLVNVGRTQRRGVEVGLDVRLWPIAAEESREGGLVWRSAYAYNDFTIEDAGPLGGAFDGARLAGLPTHVYRGQFRYDAARGDWHAAADLQYGGGAYFVDLENDVSAPSDLILGVRGGLRLSDNLDLYASAENLTNVTTTGGLTPVLSVVDDETRALTPLRGLSVYAGLAYSF